MNNITVAGNIGKDAETRFMPNGDPVCSFSVADSQGKDKPTIWWNCSLFGKRAESLAPYLTKGQPVAVSGNVTERVYTDKNGQERKAIDIRVADVALQGGKREGTAPVKTPDDQVAHVRKPAAQTAGFDDDSDVPF
jgi:single-strand DNA-binding protein